MFKLNLNAVFFVTSLFLNYFPLNINGQGIPIEQLKQELSGFFNDTYITKWKSIFDPKTKTFKAKGYHANWELHHLHHVCISGGRDGIYVGTQDQRNEWEHKVQSAVSLNLWNKEGGRGSMDAILLNYSSYGAFTNHTYVKGNSVLIACHRQLPDLLYPSMWISKLGTIYELARLYRNSTDAGFNSSFNEPAPAAFDNMVMHQCADPAVTNWEWGKAGNKSI